jgi:hypothetical protein
MGARLEENPATGRGECGSSSVADALSSGLGCIKRRLTCVLERRDRLSSTASYVSPKIVLVCLGRKLVEI